MSGRKTISTTPAKTPQPPPPLAAASMHTTKPRSRTSSTTVSTPSRVASPKQNNNDSSPRAGSRPQPRQSVNDEESRSARTVESTDENEDPLRDSAVLVMEKELTQMLQDVTTRNTKQQTRYAYMRDTMAGKDEQIAKLKGSYETLNRELRELESLSDLDTDPAVLDALYQSLPMDQRAPTPTDELA